MDKREDGRTARRDRNTDAVLDAVHELFVEGNFAPAVEDVAARSGVSLRSVYRYFEDAEELIRLAIERRIAIVGDLYELPRLGAGSRPERIAAFVEQRLALHAKLAASVRAAMLAAPSSPQIAARVDDRRRLLAEQVQAHFAPELDQLDRNRRREVGACIDALCSFESIEMLRLRTRLSLARTRRTLEGGVEALLPAASVDGDGNLVAESVTQD